jgi:hypothetical protein
MNTYRSFSRFLAVFLAVCMAVTVPAAALADDTAGGAEANRTYHEEAKESKVFPGNIVADQPGESGILVQAVSLSGDVVRVTVNGDIKAEEIGATVDGEAESVAILFVDGSVTAGEKGIEVLASGGGQAAAIAGNVTVNDGGTYGLSAESAGSSDGKPSEEESVSTDEGTVTGSFGGKVLSSGAPAEAELSENTASSGADPVKETDSSEGGAEESIGTAPKYELTGGIDSVTVNPDAENREDKYQLPIQETLTDGGDASLAEAVVDSVKAPLGIYASSVGSTSELLVNNDVIVTGVDTSSEANLVESDAGYTSVTIGGKIDSTADGLNIQAAEGGWVVVNAGDVEADWIGVDTENRGGKVSVNTGGITAGEGNGIMAATSEEEGGTFVIAEGNVASTAYAIAVVNEDAGGTFVAVGGNASSSWDDPESGAGLYFRAGEANPDIGTKDGGEAIVLVTDTLSGFNGVLVADTPASAENLDLTVWQIKANKEEGGVIIKGSEEQVAALAKTISYIVKLEQPTEGGTLAAKKADGTSDLDKKFDNEGKGGYEVSYEGQNVVLKIDLQDGYQVKGAYNGEARVELLKDKNGNYYIEVPRGGGILLQAILERIKPTPEPASRPVDMNAPAALICLDSGGGVLSGHTTFLKAVGKTFVFAEEPVWEGHTFLYWQSTIHPELRYHTGDKLFIQESDTYVAVWE